MAVVRTQYGVVTASVSIPDTGADVVVDIPRPADTAETNVIDWVKRPAMRKEFEAGRCVITADATLAALNDVYYKKIEIIAVNPGMSLAPINLSFSQFPETPVAGQSLVLRTVFEATANTTQNAFSSAVMQDILKNVLLRAGEAVRLTVVNPAGGSGGQTGTFAARYDFGLNAGNFGSLPLLI